MLTSQRKKLILEKLAAEGQVQSRALSEWFNVSEDTIRRDLRELSAEGRLQRVHGGALPASAAVADYAGRSQLSIDSKRAVARRAAALIEPGQIVMLDGGTTTGELVKCLPSDLAITVITHSPGIALQLVEHLRIEVILIGGRLFKHSIVSVGAAAIEAMSHLRADLFFLGVTGVHADAGLSTGDYEEACVKRALASRAAETVVMASREKLNAASAFCIGDMSLVNTLVVEGDTAESLLTPFEARGVTVVRA